MQSGYVYHYAFTMIIGVFALLSWFGSYAEDARARMTQGLPVPLPRHLGADRRRASPCSRSAATATPAPARWIALVGALAGLPR